MGKAGWNVRLLVAAMALKLAANWFLCAIPEVNIQGAALGTLASYLFLAAAQLGCLRRATGAVSYTHLDVYKRQSPPCASPTPNGHERPF